ncbi:MAG TPA: hypothetical protein VGJ05_14590, partial [Fimbriiglobus sp.]
MPRAAFALVVGMAAALSGRAADPVGSGTKVLSTVLRGMLIENIPTPALESKLDWGRQKSVTTGLTFRKVGPVRWNAVPQKGMRNDGHWQKFRGTVEDPAKSLMLAITDV